MNQLTEKRVFKWLAVGFAAYLLINLMVVISLVIGGDSLITALRSMGNWETMRLRHWSSYDSWGPMFAVYKDAHTLSPGTMYDPFFEEGRKFQYPPSSLLFFKLFPPELIEKEFTNQAIISPYRQLITTIGRMVILLTAISSVAILWVSTYQTAQKRWPRTQLTYGISLIAFLIGITFYPTVKGFSLGQIQIFLNALIALGVLFHLLGWQKISGICFGLCCLVKPQYGLILLWALLRKQGSLILGIVATLGVGLLTSVALYGIENHLQYLEVLSAMSRQGETFWPNQSVNGLMNRFLENGQIYPFTPADFAPFHPLIYVVTVASSLALMVIAFWPAARHYIEMLFARLQGKPINLLAPTNLSQPRKTTEIMMVLAISTLASPIAWEHHYGSFLPLLAAAFPLIMRFAPLGKWTAPLFAFSYLAMSNALERPEFIFANPWLGLIGSHIFFGAIVFYFLLLAVRIQLARAHAPAPMPAYAQTEMVAAD